MALAWRMAALTIRTAFSGGRPFAPLLAVWPMLAARPIWTLARQPTTCGMAPSRDADRPFVRQYGRETLEP